MLKIFLNVNSYCDQLNVCLYALIHFNEVIFHKLSLGKPSKKKKNYKILDIVKSKPVKVGAQEGQTLMSKVVCIEKVCFLAPLS